MCLISPLRPPAGPQASKFPVSRCRGRGNLRSPHSQKLPIILTPWVPLPARAVCIGRKPTLRKTNDGKDLPPTPTFPGKRCFRDRQGLSGARRQIPPSAEPTLSPRGIIRVPCNHMAPGNVSRTILSPFSAIRQLFIILSVC